MTTSACKTCLLIVFTAFAASSQTTWAQKEDAPNPARALIEKAIDAMGGDAYRNVRSSTSQGRLFTFSKRGKGFSMYHDWTVYDPVKSRFQMGEGKRGYVEIYNAELHKGWSMEGEREVSELPAEQVKTFFEEVSVDLDVLLHARLDEEGMNLFYYGPDEIASGEGKFEAVEFVDQANNSAVVFFDRDTHLPSRIETHFTDKMGVRHKREQERFNWHVIEGVNVAMNLETLTDGERSSQQFIEQITFNPDIPPSTFEEPVPTRK